MNASESGFESRVPPVATSAEQLLTGLQVAQSGSKSGTACGEKLREGQTISVYASHPARKRDFEAARVYWRCGPCFKPTLGSAELLARATLTTPQCMRRRPTCER